MRALKQEAPECLVRLIGNKPGVHALGDLIGGEDEVVANRDETSNSPTDQSEAKLPVVRQGRGWPGFGRSPDPRDRRFE